MQVEREQRKQKSMIEQAEKENAAKKELEEKDK